MASAGRMRGTGLMLCVVLALGACAERGEGDTSNLDGLGEAVLLAAWDEQTRDQTVERPDIGADLGDLALPGPYVEALFEVDLVIPFEGNPDIAGHAWAPADIASGPYPLFVYHPGFGATWDMYRELAAHVASHGFVVVGLNHGANHLVNARQSLRAMDWIDGPDSPVADRVDSARVGVGGHSMGGKVAFLAAALDNPGSDRIAAVLGWDPVDSAGAPGSDPTEEAPSVTPELMPDIDAAQLIFGAPAANCNPEGNNHQDYFDAGRDDVPSVHVLFPDSDHMDWVDMEVLGLGTGIGALVDSLGGLVCGGGGSDVKAAVQEATRRGTVAWLGMYLKGQSALESQVSGDLMKALSAEVDITSRAWP